MKLSNKILIAFFGFIFLYLSAVFAEIRFRGNPTLLDDANTIAETVDISGVRHLVVNNLDQHIYISGAAQPRIEVRSLTGDVLHKLKYTLSHDTLTLHELNKAEKEGIHISIFLTENNFSSIKTNKAHVFIDGITQPSLSIFQEAGQISLRDNNQIAQLQLDIQDEAYFSVSNSTIDTVSVDVDNSRVHFYSPVIMLKGSMRNLSYIRMGGLKEVQFKKDDSSTLHFY